MGGVVSDVADTVGDIGGKLGNVVGSAADWATSHPLETAMLAAGVYYAPDIGAFVNENGAVLTAEEAGLSPVLDYSMPTSTGGLGLQGSAALDGTLSSGLAAPASGSLGGGLGLTASEAANLAAMGGGQGLLANAAGGGVLGETGVNTGLFTAANLYPEPTFYSPPTYAEPPPTPDPTVVPTTGLTPTQIATLTKTGVGLLGGAAAAGSLAGLLGGSGNVTLPTQDRSGISSGSAQYSPEYYQAIQAKYNQMMPQQPRDVTTELKNWYETKYAPKVTQ